MPDEIIPIELIEKNTSISRLYPFHDIFIAEKEENMKHCFFCLLLNLRPKAKSEHVSLLDFVNGLNDSLYL